MSGIKCTLEYLQVYIGDHSESAHTSSKEKNDK